MVPQGRIELPTSPLPRVRSTTELQQRLCSDDPERVDSGCPRQGRAIVCEGGNCQAPLALCRDERQCRAMDEKSGTDGGQDTGKLTREERLAAKLRENLRRRKAQARAHASRGNDDIESGRLSKPSAES